MDNNMVPDKPEQVINAEVVKCEAINEAIKPVPVEAVPCEIKARENDNIKTVVIDKPLSLKHSLFCEYVIKHELPPIEAYLKVYPTVKRASASSKCSLLLSKVEVRNELSRLRNAKSTNKMELIENLHNKAVETLESIMVNSDKDSVRLGAVNAIINRTVPVIAKSMHVGVKVSREEIDRRYNALQE